MQRTARVTMLAVEVTNSTDVVERSTTSVSTAKRLADDATCEPTSCASSSFGAAKSSYIPTTSSICGNGRFAFWISNRDRQKPGSLVAWQAGPRRHRKNAAVRAGTCEFWISTSTIRPWQNRSWSRRPCSAWRECCRTRVIETCLRSCSIKSWRGPYNGSKNTHNFNRIVSACRRSMIGSFGSARTGGRADEVPDPGASRGR